MGTLFPIHLGTSLGRTSRFWQPNGNCGVKFTPKQRIAVFALTTVFVAAVVGWALYRAWTALAEIDKKDAEFNNLGEKFKFQVGLDAKLLEDMQQQYSDVADHVTKTLNELNGSLVAFAMRNDQQYFTNFWAKSLDLKMWLHDQEALVNQGELTLNTPSATFRANVRQSVQDIGHAYDAYLASARKFTDDTAITNAPAVRLKQFATVQSDLQGVLFQANRAKVRAEAIRLSQFSSKEWFPKGEKVLSTLIPELRQQLSKVHRRLILASVASAIGLLTVILVVAYRLWISPLLARLVESDEIVTRNQKLAQKGQTASELAHEIRNPLAAINFRLYSLQKALNSTTHEHQDAALIRKEVRRLNAILEDFLHLDRPPTPDFADVSAAAVLREVGELMRPQFTDQAIRLNVEAVDDTKLQADPHQLQQVLLNLVKNAAESIGRGGTVTLRTRKGIEQLRRKPTEVMIIEVCDTGPGISPEIQSRMFDPFFTTKKGGTGLGLSVAERIVERHGGLLDFDSKPNEGTTFRVVLPVGQTS